MNVIQKEPAATENSSTAARHASWLHDLFVSGMTVVDAMAARKIAQRKRVSKNIISNAGVRNENTAIKDPHDCLRRCHSPLYHNCRGCKAMEDKDSPSQSGHKKGRALNSAS